MNVWNRKSSGFKYHGNSNQRPNSYKLTEKRGSENDFWGRFRSELENLFFPM